MKGTDGKGLQEKKGASAEKLESWMRRPVQPESAMSGDDRRRADTAPNKEGGDVVIEMGG
jgi:hypothetical protein